MSQLFTCLTVPLIPASSSMDSDRPCWLIMLLTDCDEMIKLMIEPAFCILLFL